MPADSFSRLRRLSGVLRWIALAGAIGLGVIAIILIAIPSLLAGLAAARVSLADTDPGPMGAAVLALAMLMTLGPAIWVMAQLSALFARYARGDVLSQGTAACQRALGRGLLAVAVGRALSPTVAAVALTLNNAPGSRTLLIHLSSDVLVAALFGGLMFTIGWATAEGARLAEENRSFV